MQQKNLTVNVISAAVAKPKRSKKLKLPEAIFGQKVDEKLLTQAVRVYSFKQRQGTVKVKTRGEVSGSRRKIWRQKGTGRARHGDRYAPIFVGGGVAHGPQPKDWSLKLSKKMRRQALFSALSGKFSADNIYIIADLDKLKAKTKEYYKLFTSELDFDLEKNTVLFITDDTGKNILRNIRNIKNIVVLNVKLLNAYDILRHKKIIFTEEAVEELEKHFLTNKKDAIN